MSVEDRLARLEHENRRLRLGLLAVIVALIVGCVALMGVSTADAQGRVVTARAFLLVDDAGEVRADLTIVDGSPRLAMWQPGTQVPVVRLGTDVSGMSHLLMWRPGADQTAIALRVDKFAEGFVTSLRMGELVHSGEITMNTGPDGRVPAAHITPPGGGTAVWSAP